VSSDDWVVIAQTAPRRTQFDSDLMELLFLESVLTDQGVEVGFQPFRPDDPLVMRSPLRAFQLLVPARDAQRARELVAEAQSQPADDAYAE